MASFSRTEIENRMVDGVSDTGIRKTDDYKGLECFCSDNPPTNDFEKNIRGYIFYGNNLILKSLPYAETYSSDSVVGNLSDYTITLMKEGTSIRVFNFKNEWFITTHRKIDAFKSKWGRESFGEIFETNILKKTGKNLKDFLSTLNKDHSYIFLVGTTETTRIVSPSYQDIILLSCMDKLGNVIKSQILDDWYLEELYFQNINDILDYVKSLRDPFVEGYGLFLFSKSKSFKIINQKYSKLSDLRNNLPSIPFAYIHNVFDAERKNMFRQLYPYFKTDFDFYDIEIKDIAKDLLSKYFRRYIKKEKFIVSKHEHNILYHIHGIFLSTKNFIKEDQVIEAFSKVPPANINKIISERKMAKKLKENKSINLKLSV